MPKRSASAFKAVAPSESDVAAHAGRQARVHAPAIAGAALPRPVMNRPAMLRNLNRLAIRPIPLKEPANQRQAPRIRKGAGGAGGEEGEEAERPALPPPRQNNFRFTPRILFALHSSLFTHHFPLD